MSGWLIDLRPVRESPAFRGLWVGSTLSLIGSALTTFALPLQVYDVTRSSLAVGLLGVAELIPALIVGLAGGALADGIDRRVLASLSSVGLALISAVLAFQASAHLDLLWLLYMLAAMHAALAAISGPLYRTFIPSLLPTEQLVAGMALNRLSFQLMLTLGPALAGLIAAAPGLGLPGCYLIDAVSFAASLYGLARLPNLPYPQLTRRALRAVADGLRFIRRSGSLAAPLRADLVATVFGLPVALFPAINAQRFGGDPRTLGLFATAIGAGGLLTATLSGPLHRIARQGRAMLVSVAVWGAAFAGFAIAPGLVLTLATLAIAGAADSITVVLRGTIIQTNTPEELRGRITAVEYVAGVSGGQLGNLEAGALGAVTTPSASALIGGLLTIAGALTLAIKLPDFVRQHAAAADLANARQA
ncbi:MAG: MFS transporter [Solirubrobacterales bacterium]|nr:MFS transporter [Solirubrobacterales bacterium]